MEIITKITAGIIVFEVFSLILFGFSLVTIEPSWMLFLASNVCVLIIAVISRLFIWAIDVLFEF